MRTLLLTTLLAVPTFLAAFDFDAAPDLTPAWIVIDDRDLAALERVSGGPLPQAVLRGGGRSVFRTDRAGLPGVSAAMHEAAGKCGGFFAFDSEAEALAALAPAPAPRARTYTLDRRAQTEALVAAVRAPEIQAVIERLQAFHNRYYTADTGVAAASWILERWRALAAGRDDVTAQAWSHPGWPQTSAVLTIRGAVDPDTVVVLGGHLDSIGGWWGGKTARAPGADDNASGIAVLTETLRVLMESGYRPAVTVKFMGYAAEEVGLRGSREIADAFARDGVEVAGVLQFDMTNYKGAAGDIYLLSDHTDKALSDFLGRLIDAYVKVPWGWTSCGYACSDHASWTRAGYPAATPFESTKDGMNRRIHTDGDTLANSGGDAAHAAHFARLAVAYVSEVAKAAPADPS